MITIGRLAEYAGVTIRAVRHYHQVGLLEEPPRDSSGYRRYTARHAIDLIKIKTLSEAGVPLARIKELMAAEEEHLAVAIDEIDRNLQARIEELTETRKRIRNLAGGGRMFLPGEVADFLDRLTALGVSARSVETERDLWILARQVSPEEADRWVKEKSDALSDVEFQQIYLDTDRAQDWAPDDPRLDELASRIVELAARSGVEEPEPEAGALALARLIASSMEDSSPALRRLNELAKVKAETLRAADS